MTTPPVAIEQLAVGEFTVKLPALAFEGVPENSKLGRRGIDKAITGDLQASTHGQMLSALTDTLGSAGYVAIEQVTGTLHTASGPRSGSFVLQHSGVMDKGVQSQSITVVPDSGTGQLAGLRGVFKIIIEAGRHRYEFRYTLN